MADTLLIAIGLILMCVLGALALWAVGPRIFLGGGGDKPDTIRLGTSADHDEVKALVDLYQAELKHEPREIGRDEFNQIAFSEWWTLVHIGEDGKIDGILTARDKNGGFIRMVVVAPAARSKGVGSLLLSEAVRRIPRAGLYVESSNPNYARLLDYYAKRFGFAVTAKDGEGARMARTA